ncbi:DUF4367 domain-containing protein [Paenibacillus sp. UNC451MF]|uniref:DUF4367 domain-containing protein n=1 Tax=Paenibacillus sp. UNC451MF TaxID=1449063 RepID=UPI00048EA591|nr:DUF4367 domain-containing protein [Paenibacillus sp. UNC451MF]
MNKGWLLLFKEDIVNLTSSVQFALFEQYVRIVSEQELLKGLDVSSARYVVKTAFLQAASKRFIEVDEDQIAEKLVKITEALVARQKPSQTPGLEVLGASTSRLMEAWDDASSVLQRKLRRHRRSRLMLSVCTFTLILLVGGFVFSTETPAQKPVHEPLSLSSSTSDASQPVDGVNEIRDMKVTASQAKVYADFKMRIPNVLPDGYHFEEARVFLNEGATKSRHIILVYTNESEYLLRVSYYKLAPNSVMSTGFYMPESTEDVFLRGSKGLLAQSKDHYARLDWLEGDVFISISGREIEGQQLVKMAESLK